MRKARAGQRHLNPQPFSGNYASPRAQGMDQPGTAGTRQGPLPKPPQQRGLPLGAPAEASAATAQDPPQVSATRAFSAAAPAAAGVGAAGSPEALVWAVRGLAAYNQILEHQRDYYRATLEYYRESCGRAYSSNSRGSMRRRASQPRAALWECSRRTRQTGTRDARNGNAPLASPRRTRPGATSSTTDGSTEYGSPKSRYKRGRQDRVGSARTG